jgi:hypothetical protein
MSDKEKITTYNQNDVGGTSYTVNQNTLKIIIKKITSNCVEVNCE